MWTVELTGHFRAQEKLLASEQEVSALIVGMKSQLPTSIADKHKGINETDQKMMKMVQARM